MHARTSFRSAIRSEHAPTFLIVAISLATALAASPAGAMEHAWSRGFGGADVDRAECAVVDASRNVVIAGTFSGTSDFGGDSLFSSGGSNDAFVAKYDRFGNHLWSQRFGGNSNDAATCLAVDADGNVVVAGYFLGSIDFGGGVLTSAGLDDIFVAKLDPDGNHVWSRRFGDGNNDHADGVCVDESGRMCVTGYIRGSVDFGGGALESAGAADVFVASFDAAGSHLWSRRCGAGLDDFGVGIACDVSGGAYVTGSFQDAVSFGGAPLESAGLNDAFVAKYNAAGAHVWSRRFGDWNFQTGRRIAADEAGNVVVAGSFFGAIDLGGGAFTSAGLFDVFVATFNAGGAHVWSRGFGDGFDDQPWGLALDPSGVVSLTGEFGGTVDVGDGPMTSAGGADAFAVSYGTDGTHVWSRAFGGVGADKGRAVAVDGSSALVFAGDFGDTVDVGGGPLASDGQSDVFVTRYETQVASAAPSTRLETGVLAVYPNPFNPSTSIEYTVSAPGPVTIAVYDASGHHLETIVHDHDVAPGVYVARYAPAGLSSGVYFVRAEIGATVSTRRVILVK